MKILNLIKEVKMEAQAHPVLMVKEVVNVSSSSDDSIEIVDEVEGAGKAIYWQTHISTGLRALGG